VDDGSEDSARDIVKSIHSRRVKYYYKEHGGLGDTRNFGIRQAKGEYIFFLDSDDLLHEGALAALLSYSKKYDTNVTEGAVLRRDKGGNESVSNKKLFERTRVDIIKKRSDLFFDTLSTNKLYRTQFLRDNKIEFERGLYEDIPFSAQVYGKAERIGIIDSFVYIWLVGDSGTTITTKLSADNFESRVDALKRQLRYIPECLRYRWFGFFFYRHLTIYAERVSSYNQEDKKRIFEVAKSFYEEFKSYAYMYFLRRPHYKLLMSALAGGDFDLFIFICGKMDKARTAAQAVARSGGR
jgi:CDP-glycerol glycerophosphotransferase